MRVTPFRHARTKLRHPVAHLPAFRDRAVFRPRLTERKQPVTTLPIARVLTLLGLFAALAGPARAADEKVDQGKAAGYIRTEDVIYGRKYGVALTMDVFAPNEKGNGRGIIWCVSGG